MQRILLIEPGYSNKYPPLGLMKISAYHKLLGDDVTFAKGKSVKEVIDFVVDTLNRQPGLEVEYYEIVDGSTLQPIEKWEESTEPVGCIAIYCGDVRLIDNIKYKRITT